MIGTFDCARLELTEDRSTVTKDEPWRFRISIFSDGTYPLDGGAFFGVVPKVMWSSKAPRRRKELHHRRSELAVDSHRRSRTSWSRPGWATSFRRKWSRSTASRRNCSRTCERPESRPTRSTSSSTPTCISITAAGTRCAKGTEVVATFPKAKYYAQEGEWRHAQEQHMRDAISYISDNYNPLIEIGQMQLLRGDQEIVPGISVTRVPRPHGAYAGGGGGQRRQNRLLHFRSHSHRRAHRSDVGDGLRSVTHRHDRQQKRYYAQAFPEKWLTVFTHDDAVPWAYIEQDVQAN